MERQQQQLPVVRLENERSPQWGHAEDELIVDQRRNQRPNRGAVRVSGDSHTSDFQIRTGGDRLSKQARNYNTIRRRYLHAYLPFHIWDSRIAFNRCSEAALATA